MMLCDVILNYRAAHGLSQRQFAALSGLSHAFISMIETQNNPATKKDIAPSVESLRRLAQAMGMTLHELIQEVSGSIPLFSTKKARKVGKLPTFRAFCFGKNPVLNCGTQSYCIPCCIHP